MYILLDPSTRDTVRILSFGECDVREYVQERKNRDVLQVLDGMLQQEDAGPADVEGVVVVVGAGSFTSTRIATTIANAFAYARQIPLLAISLEQAADVQALIGQLKAQPPGQYVSATYSGEPNIGKKK